MTTPTITCRACSNLNEGTQTLCFRCGQPLRVVDTPPAREKAHTAPVPGAAPVPMVQPGQVLDGRYRVHRQLGEGAMGQVYEATDERLSRRVALKVIAPAILEGRNARERVEREAKALGRLRHPNVIEIHNFFDHRGGLVLELELVRGGSLAEAIPTGGLPAEEACRLLRGVLDGLQALHGTGLVHRDLKPANVLLTESGVPKVADLGIAHDGDGRGLTRVGARLGTPEYMAPEQILGKSVDARTDLYAAGIMLWELLSGEVPFAGNTDFEIQQQQVDGTPDLSSLRNVPSAVLDALKKALEKDPAQRFASAAAFRDALTTDALSNIGNAPVGPSAAPNQTPAPPPATTSPVPPSPPVHAPAPAPPSKAPFVLIAGAVGALVVAAVIAFSGDGDPSRTTTVAPLNATQNDGTRPPIERTEVQPAAYQPPPPKQYTTERLKFGTDFIVRVDRPAQMRTTHGSEGDWFVWHDGEADFRVVGRMQTEDERYYGYTPSVLDKPPSYVAGSLEKEWFVQSGERPDGRVYYRRIIVDGVRVAEYQCIAPKGNRACAGSVVKHLSRNFTFE